MSESVLDLVAGDRVRRVKKINKKRPRGTILDVFVRDGGRVMYNVRWDGDYTDSVNWYHANEITPVGRGASVKAITQKRKRRWWEGLDWGGDNRRWKSNTEKVEELFKELTTPPQDAEKHVL